MPRHSSGHEVAAGEPLELHVLLGMFPPVTCGLGGAQRGKERPLKVASREAINIPCIMLRLVPLTLYHNSTE